MTVASRIEDATLIPQWIAERSAARVKEAAGPEEWIGVRIGGQTYAYRVEVRAMRGGKPVGAAREPVACECTSEEMLALVDGEVSRAVQELERAETVASEPTTDPEPTPTPDGGQPLPGDPPPPRWLLPTGATLTAVGGAGVIAGAVMIAVGPGDPLSGLQSFRRDFRNPAGNVTLGVGSALLVSGVTMLAVHFWCIRHPSRCGTNGRARVHTRRSVGPMAGAGELGLSISGRF